MPQSSLAEAYLDGEGVEQDFEEAARWYRTAAEGGDPDASFNLGMMYADCLADMDNDPDAEEWLKVAADAGHESARYLLGELGVAGYPSIDDDDEARRPYRAPLGEDADASIQGGGVVIPMAREETDAAGPETEVVSPVVDPEQASTIANNALREAWRGDPDAQRFVGHAYLDGRGLPRDASEALRWFRAAARQGDSAAQNNLGAMYHRGEGLPKPDPDKALKWYRASAEQGERVALHNLAGMHAHGEAGLEVDHAKAAELNRAAADMGWANCAVQPRPLLLGGCRAWHSTRPKR